MKRAILFLFILFSYSHSQSLHVESGSYNRVYEIQDLKQLQFIDLDSLSHASLSIHTVNGIDQIALSDIDSILFMPEKILRVHYLTFQRDIRLADIDHVKISSLTFPDRNDTARSGSEFMNDILGTTFQEREPLILAEILAGNIPDISREFIRLRSVFKDANGVEHTVEYDVMSDYLSIGSNQDYCRIPMGPATAQKIADAYGCILTTPKLCDDIWKHATVKLSPIPYAPVGNNNSQVYKFVEHNSDINSARDLAGGGIEELIAGIKKDVVICNIMASKPGKVCIYGWHYTSGAPIQPVYSGHGDYYVDYSHGIRLVNEYLYVDGVTMSAHDILKDPVLFKLLSNESTPMTLTRYPK
ncbi:MAG: hypothetical protein WCT23_09695 [Candidatus Neomarinimicrobiota bacterium]